MKTKYLLLILLVFLSTGCIISPYKNSKYGDLALESWFNDKTLGEKRKEIENINQIISSDCKYLEHKSNKYVFKCKLEYTAKGETVIPLSKHSKVDLYVVFIKKSGNKFDSKVYNSSSKEGIWEKDQYLDY